MMAGRTGRIVGSANVHDASSAHSNVALKVTGPAIRPLLESEFEVARFSGWHGHLQTGPARTIRRHHPVSRATAG